MERSMAYIDDVDHTDLDDLVIGQDLLLSTIGGGGGDELVGSGDCAFDGDSQC